MITVVLNSEGCGDRLELECMNGIRGEDVQSDRSQTFICSFLSYDPRRFVFPMTAPEKDKKNQGTDEHRFRWRTC